MEHPRQIIRQAIVELLKSGKTEAGGRVFDSRDFTLNTDSTPAIVVYTQSEQLEDSEQFDQGLRLKVMNVVVECYHTGDDGAAAIDQMAWQAENILHANPTIENKVEHCRLQSTSMSFADNGELALHCAVMSFEVRYYTHLYKVDGEPPKTILYSFTPDIGKDNEPLYQELGGIHD